MHQNRHKATQRSKNPSQALLVFAKALLVFALLVPPLSSPVVARDQTNNGLVTLSIGTTGITAAIWPIMVGVKKGMFRSEGVDLQIVHIQNASANVQDLLTGNLPFVSAGADAVILPVAHGADLTAIAGIDNVFVGRLVASRNITSIADLKGKVLSVSRRNGPDAEIITEMLAEAGVNTDPTLFSVAGGSSTRLAAVVNGGASATLLIPPEDFRALAMGLNDLGLNVGRSKKLQFNVLFIDRKWGEANRPIVVKTLRGLIDSCMWLNDPKNRDEASAMLASYTKINMETARKTYDVLVTQTHSFPRAGEISGEGFANVMDMLTKFSLIRKSSTGLDHIIDDSYLQAAARH